MRLIEKIKEVRKIGLTIEIPWEVRRVLSGESKYVDVVGEDSVSLGSDFVSVEEARAAVEWYTDQLGGKIKWEK